MQAVKEKKNSTIICAAANLLHTHALSKCDEVMNIDCDRRPTEKKKKG